MENSSTFDNQAKTMKVWEFKLQLLLTARFLDQIHPLLRIGVRDVFNYKYNIYIHLKPLNSYIMYYITLIFYSACSKVKCILDMHYAARAVHDVV